MQRAVCVLTLLISHLLAPIPGFAGQSQLRFRAESLTVLDLQVEEVALSPSGLIPHPKYEGNGILPLSKDVVFIHGSLNTPAADVRSVLLRSDDGGKTWRELSMVQERGSSIFDIGFIDARHGWALTQWTVESVGDVYLFCTNNGGKTWEKRSLLLSPTVNSGVVRMKFFDPDHAQAIIRYDSVYGPSDGIELVETSDGGRTWQTVLRLKLGGIEGTQFDANTNKKTPIPSITEEINRQMGEQIHNYQPEPVAMGADGSQWRMLYYIINANGARKKLGPGDLRRDGAVYISVERRSGNNGNWEERSLIPESYHLKGDYFLPITAAASKM